VSPPLLEASGLTKRYPGVTALSGVDLTVRAGEVHVLFGENGAGKSTLIGIVSGAVRPTEGTLAMRGAPVRWAGVHDARGRGVSAVFQEFSLVPSMSVAENMFLGAERSRGGLLRRAEMRADAARILDEMGFPLDPDAEVAGLSRAERQMVEIAKALRSDLSVLILDEPTASLTDRETDALFALVARLKAEGVGIVHITHRMGEIARIGDRVTVLRDGRVAGTHPADAPRDVLIAEMTGREAGALFPAIARAPGEAVLRLTDVATPDGAAAGVTLEARRGEVLGLAGLAGSGKSEAMRAAFGARALASGRVEVHGRDRTGAAPRAMLDAGVLYLPPDRHAEGLLLARPSRENAFLAALGAAPIGRRGLLDLRAERRMAGALCERLRLSPPDPERAPEALSGGNQQKVMLMRALTRGFDCVVLDEPTVGVDVGTRAAIYGFIGELCEAGAAVVVISSDLPEVIGLVHRALVFSAGRVVHEAEGEAITEAALLDHFFDREAA
jgi:ribose transport system ATP-binding protein